MQGTPIAYLTGWREFYSMDLKVSRHVLIPRPETELLVEVALNHIEAIPAPRILDMGTGSGAIALAIAGNAPNAHLVATDIDDNALALAAENAGIHHLTNIHFLNSDWYSSLAHERFDLIAANPPYIDPKDPHLQQGDVRFEPQHALVSADHGRADLRKIIEHAPAYLEANGWLALEHGYDQGEVTRAVFKQRGFDRVETIKDLNKCDRVTIGVCPDNTQGSNNNTPTKTPGAVHRSLELKPYSRH